MLKSTTKNTIRLLESLKAEKDNITKGIAFGFAAKTVELIKKCVGKESEQYRLMTTLLYDQTVANMEYTIIPADSLIVSRVRTSDQFDSIIDACISFVKAYGLYKPPSDKKNIFGDLDNAMLWTLIVFIATTSFLAGVVVTNYGLSRLLDPSVNAGSGNKASLPLPKQDTLPSRPSNKGHNDTKYKPN